MRMVHCEMSGIILIIVLLIFCIGVAYSQEICNQAICEYHWDIRRFSTMTYYDKVNNIAFNVELNGTKLIAVDNRHMLPELYPVIGSELAPSDVITADGYKRDIITINDQFPGPDIHVLAGAQVVVHVWNRMVLEATTIHWHGIHHQDTPWMDGVPYITQCPILPRQKFTYRFIASPHGTHWYHAHMGSQRLDGLYGMLIVHPTLPTIPQFTFTVNDWLHADAVSYELQNPVGLEKSGTGEMILEAIYRDFVLDNNHATIVQYDGALINGRGRYNSEKFPLSEFNVTKDERYRFRVAAVGVEHSFEVSIDDHVMDIVSLDGADIMPVQVNSFMVHTGETMDFEIVANQPVGKYWIRANTIREGVGINPVPDGIIKGVQALLVYSGDTEPGDPTTHATVCDASHTCIIFNCPYGTRPTHHYKRCFGIEDTISTASQIKLNQEFGLDEHDDDVIEYFYNFAFSIGSAVNARKYVPVRAQPYRNDFDKYMTPCDENVCEAEGCWCTNIDKLPYNKTVQIVLINQTPGAEIMAHHTVHLHGHSFAVLKIGYAEHNESTGHWTEANADVQCFSDNMEICTKSRWSNGRPALRKTNPPIKDTVIVPARGYTVIRLRTTNPGFWFFHCHMEQHFMDGMATLLNIAPDRHRPLPPNFPDCHDFTWSEKQFADYLDQKSTRDIVTTTSGIEQDVAVAVDVGKIEDVPNQRPEIPFPGKSDIVISLSMAIGVTFGLISLGALLPMLSVFLYTWYASRTFSTKLDT